VDNRSIGRRALVAPLVLRTPEQPPNMRLKLTAPVLEGRIAFVEMKTRRRSLGASR
jgi:hypothetical protein